MTRDVPTGRILKNVFASTLMLIVIAVSWVFANKYSREQSRYPLTLAIGAILYVALGICIGCSPRDVPVLAVPGDAAVSAVEIRNEPAPAGEIGAPRALPAVQIPRLLDVLRSTHYVDNKYTWGVFGNLTIIATTGNLEASFFIDESQNVAFKSNGVYYKTKMPFRDFQKIIEQNITFD